MATATAGKPRTSY